MFKLIFGALKGFLSVIGSVMIGIVLLALFSQELAGVFVSIILGLFVGVLLFAGMFLDYKLRKKFNMRHKHMFSPLWTALSIVELSLFAVFIIAIILGLIPISVLIYSIVVYTILSVLILSNKIKKVSKFTT